MTFVVLWLLVAFVIFAVNAWFQKSLLALGLTFLALALLWPHTPFGG